MKLSIPLKSKLLNFVVILITICFIILPVILFLSNGEVFAQTTGTGLEQTATEAGLPRTTGIATIIGQIIYAILGFLGVIFILLLIYGGFLRMTAQGNPEQVKKSMGIITSAIIGVIIILASYAITSFVLSSIGAGVGGGGDDELDQLGIGKCLQTDGNNCIDNVTQEACFSQHGTNYGWYEGQYCTCSDLGGTCYPMMNCPKGTHSEGQKDCPSGRACCATY